MPKCERCQINDARVRLDAINNGRREHHYLCRECAEELMGEQMQATDSDDLKELFNGMGSGIPGGNAGILGFAPRSGSNQSSGAQAGTATARARRQAKQDPDPRPVRARPDRVRRARASSTRPPGASGRSAAC